MDNRFSSLFNLTEEQAIEILDGPAGDSDEASSRYIAASHLVNFDTEQSLAALMRAASNTDSDLDNRIVRRKAVESLGRLKAKQALPTIENCLTDEDNYLVENAAWAIGEIGTTDSVLLEKLAQQLARPEQSYRTIIHTLANLNYAPAAGRIRPFATSTSEPIASAALSALYRLEGEEAGMARVLAFLQSTNVNARRGSIQDLIDARYYKAIDAITQCPVSSVFRLRGVKQLARAGIEAGQLTFVQVQPAVEKLICDRPSDVALVHAYAQLPDIAGAIAELYGTDFGRCYLAAQTLIDHYAEAAPAALITSYKKEGYNDYGAHYHIMRLFGWLKVREAYDLLVEALQNKAPQFQKSRVAAAIALGELTDERAIAPLKTALTVPIWDLQYAALMALDRLGAANLSDIALPEPLDWLVQAKLEAL